MSRYKRDLSLANAGEVEREQVVFRNQAHNGQHPETEAKYRDAIAACGNILYLNQTIADIARMYGLEQNCLSNQLKRHYPEIIPIRRELRVMKGYEKAGRYGLKESTQKNYAKAVEMLKDPSITVLRAAEKCGVSYSGLQQHLLFYHKDIADARMMTRCDALLKPLAVGDFTATGGIRVPRPGAVALYSPAVEMYKNTKLSIVEIARRCGISEHNFRAYIQRWHGDLMEQRRARVQKELEGKKKRAKINVSRSALAREKYLPSVELVKSGYSVTDAAKKLNVNVDNLRSWLKFNFPELVETAQIGMMRLPSGKMALRKTFYKYKPIAQYIKVHPEKPTKVVAEKWNVPISSLDKRMRSLFPEIWELHCQQSSVQGKIDPVNVQLLEGEEQIPRTKRISTPNIKD